MYKERVNGMDILYPDNKNNILRSIITNNKFDFVFLSRGESESNYVEESPNEYKESNMIESLDILKKKKLDDLEIRYNFLKSIISNSNSREELNNIIIF